ncbi:ChaB family protein [Psychrobacter pygoscelis]|uniref:ChaB family protein n=1 Tax=Psychrobacter pygoscelis TaxID=2488563 RepID=UPI0010397BE4|nr:ChaB family protein [Psychrobacter pygoscelis]
MPYDKLSDLPEQVTANLPKHGQEIFLAAFNSASEQYDDESRWFATAWAAVENVYQKNDDGKWVKRPDHK